MVSFGNYHRMKLLMVHGNGGATARFSLFAKELEKEDTPWCEVVLPKLRGFEGRPIPPDTPLWDGLLEDIGQSLQGNTTSDWIFYGHGIGGSILLEAAHRGWAFAPGIQVVPKQVILHAPIGATLSKRWFPKLMKPNWVRTSMKWLVAHPALRPVWEKRLFLYPDRIPKDLRQTFFADYRRCDAFAPFFDLITTSWYEQIQSSVEGYPFHFLWGTEERVVASKFVTYWKNDFPNSRFTLVDGWDHFPMLDTPEAFHQYLKEMILQEAPKAN
jgi:pimeloyl-ACP methyl ester carboxylesterase